MNDAVSYFDVRKYICSSGICSAYDGNVNQYFDPVHLSMDGFWNIGNKLVASEGIPREFEFLETENARSTALLREKLETRVKDKFSEIEKNGRLIEARELAKLFYGDGRYSILDGFPEEEVEIFDRTKSKFEVVSVPIDLEASGDPSLKGAFGYLSFSLDMFISDGEVHPMIRVTDAQLDESLKYETVVDLSRGVVRAKKSQGNDEIYISGVEGYKRVFMKVPLSSDASDISLTIYPAVSLNFPSYSKEAIGNTKIKNLRVLIEK